MPRSLFCAQRFSPCKNYLCPGSEGASPFTHWTEGYEQCDKKKFFINICTKILKLRQQLFGIPVKNFSAFFQKNRRMHSFDLDLRCFADKHDLLQFAKVIMKVRSPLIFYWPVNGKNLTRSLMNPCRKQLDFFKSSTSFISLCV